jgi:ribosomal protein L4
MTKERHASSVEEPVLPPDRGGAEQPDQKSPDHSSEEVNRQNIQRVVHVQLELDGDRQSTQRTGGHADNGRAEQIHEPAGGRYRDQPRHSSGSRPQRRHLPRLQLLNRDPC